MSEVAISLRSATVTRQIGPVDAAKDAERDGRADALFGQQAMQIVEAGHGVRIERDDDVAVAQPGGRAGPSASTEMTSTPDACARWWKRETRRRSGTSCPATPR